MTVLRMLSFDSAVDSATVDTLFHDENDAENPLLVSWTSTELQFLQSCESRIRRIPRPTFSRHHWTREGRRLHVEHRCGQRQKC